MSYIVYSHTNNENGKKYIGMTSQKPESRWRNGEGYKNNIYFYRAIQKYGWNNFTHSIIRSELTQNEAEELEKKLIEKYKTYCADFGYNIEKGGNSGDKYTDETRKKISIALKGKTKTEEHRKKLSDAMRGRSVSLEVKKKISEATRGCRNPMYGRKRNAINKKSVICIETGEVYESVTLAAKTIGADQSAVSRACNNKNKTVRGTHWQFLEVQ